MSDSNKERSGCPLCKSGCLRLLQISLTKAVELCSTPKCKYPYSTSQPLRVVERSADDTWRDWVPVANSGDTVKDYHNAFLKLQNLPTARSEVEVKKCFDNLLKAQNTPATSDDAMELNECHNDSSKTQKTTGLDNTVELNNHQKDVATGSIDGPKKFELLTPILGSSLDKIVGLMEPEVLEDLLCSLSDEMEAQKSDNSQASTSSSAPDVLMTEAENKETIQEMPVEYAPEVSTEYATPLQNYDVAPAQPQPMSISLHCESNRVIITLPGVQENVRFPRSPFVSPASVGSSSVQGDHWSLATTHEATGNYFAGKEGGEAYRDPVNEVSEESSSMYAHHPAAQLTRRGSRGRGSRGKRGPKGPRLLRPPPRPLLFSPDGLPIKRRRGRPRTKGLTLEMASEAVVDEDTISDLPLGTSDVNSEAASSLTAKEEVENE